MSAVSVCALAKLYPAVRALHRVSFDVASGSCCVIRGDNGAGKTTLLSCIAGLIRPSAGEVLLDDVSVVRRRDVVRYVLNQSGFYDVLTIRENLSLFADVQGIGAGEVQATIENFSLESFADRRFSECSRGVQRRASIASACMGHLELLVLDEPFANLDASSQELLERQLIALKNSGVTIVLATHDAERADRIADCTVHLVNGSVVTAASEVHCSAGG